MARAASYVQDDEKVLRQSGRHPASLIDEVLGILALGAILVVGTFFAWRLAWGVPLAGWGWILVGAQALLIAWWLLLRHWRMVTSLYVITDTRVYMSYGRLRWFVYQTTFDKITDLHIRQSLFGRAFGFGTLRVMTAGSGLALVGVRDPFGVKHILEEARSAFLWQLARTAQAQTRHRRAEATRTAGGPMEVRIPSDRPAGTPPSQGSGAGSAAASGRPRVGMGEARWQGAPSPASMIGQFVSMGFIVLFALIMGVVGAAAQPDLLWLAVVFVAMGIFNGLRAFVVLRYTRFHVHEGGVVLTSGWLTRRRVETTYSKVTDVQTTQGVMGRMFGYGEIRINTAGSNDAPVVFTGVRDPERVKRLVDAAREA